METIKHWLSRFHAVVIGPGLGRDPSILKTVGELIEFLRLRDTPVVIDAVRIKYNFAAIWLRLVPYLPHVLRTITVVLVNNRL